MRRRTTYYLMWTVALTATLGGALVTADARTRGHRGGVRHVSGGGNNSANGKAGAEELKQEKECTTPAKADALSVDIAAATQPSVAAGVDTLFLGDQPVAGWETTGSDAWQQYFANGANVSTPSEKTQGLLYRIELKQLDAFKPKTIVLEIGRSNLEKVSAKATALGIARDASELGRKFPSARIILCGLFPSADGAMQKKILDVNHQLRGFDNGLKHRYLDLSAKFYDKDQPVADLTDSGGLTAQGYVVWAKGILPLLATTTVNKAPAPVPVAQNVQHPGG